MPLNPFGKESPVSLGGLQGEINHLFDRLWHAGLCTGPFDGQECAPVLDLFERPEGYTVHVEVPGLDADTIELSCLGRSLTVRGTKPAPGTDDQDCRTVRSERRFGAFCRTVDLPEEVDADAITAKCHNGVLEITLPKSKAGIPKKINVEVAE